MKQILLPTDFSTASENTYRLAAYVAKQIGAQITLCNLIRSWSRGILDYTLYDDSQFIEEMDDLQFESSFRSMNRVLTSDIFKDVNIQEEVKMMSPNDWKNEFIDEVNNDNYDLVIIGHNVAGKESSFFTDDLSQKLSTPVLACTSKVVLDPSKPILVCTDFENVNASFFKRIDMLSSSINTPKTIFYANTKKDFLTDEAINKSYRNLVNKYHLKNTELKSVNSQKAISAIKNEINKGDYQYVALATHGVSGLLKFFKTSVTEEIFDRSPIPVLSINLHDYLEETEGARSRSGFTG